MNNISELKRERDNHTSSLAAIRADLAEAEGEWESLRQWGPSKQLNAVETKIATLTRRCEGSARAFAEADAAIGAAEKHLRTLRHRMGEALLPHLIDMVILTPDAQRVIAPMLTEYNALLGDDDE